MCSSLTPWRGRGEVLAVFVFGSAARGHQDWRGALTAEHFRAVEDFGLCPVAIWPDLGQIDCQPGELPRNGGDYGGIAGHQR